MALEEAIGTRVSFDREPKSRECGVGTVQTAVLDENAPEGLRVRLQILGDDGLIYHRPAAQCFEWVDK